MNRKGKIMQVNFLNKIQWFLLFIFLVLNLAQAAVTSTNTQTYKNTNYYVAYDKNNKLNYALILPSVKKVYIHKAGDVKNLKRVDTAFNTFPTYNNGEVCFSNLKNNLQNTNDISVMENSCYVVNFFYTQKAKVATNTVFMLYYKDQDIVYEGYGGEAKSFKIVKDINGFYDQNVLVAQNYETFQFNVENASIVLGKNSHPINSNGMMTIEMAQEDKDLIKIQENVIRVQQGNPVMLKAAAPRKGYFMQWYDAFGNKLKQDVRVANNALYPQTFLRTYNLKPGDYVCTCVASNRLNETFKNSVTIRIVANDHKMHPFVKEKFEIKSLWKQGSPYNDMVPKIMPNGKKAAVGCIATAMSQIMRTYKWPLSGRGIVGDIDLSNYIYDWDNMPKIITSKNDDVALINLHAGIAAKMKYGYSSATTSYLGHKAMTENFQYRIDKLPTMTFASPLFYALVKRAITYKRLFWISSNGHSYLLDGYLGNPEDGNVEYHINLGWGSSEWFPLYGKDLYIPNLAYETGFSHTAHPVLIYPNIEGEDQKKPNISLHGASNITIGINETYVDKGATAHDDIDGDVDVEVVGLRELEKSKGTEGTYFIYFVANDSAGNIGYQKRKVRVVDYSKPKTVSWLLHIGDILKISPHIFGAKFAKDKVKSVIWKDEQDVINTQYSYTYKALKIGTYKINMTIILNNGDIVHGIATIKIR